MYVTVIPRFIGKPVYQLGPLLKNFVHTHVKILIPLYT